MKRRDLTAYNQHRERMAFRREGQKRRKPGHYLWNGKLISPIFRKSGFYIPVGKRKNLGKRFAKLLG